MLGRAGDGLEYSLNRVRIIAGFDGNQLYSRAWVLFSTALKAE